MKLLGYTRLEKALVLVTGVVLVAIVYPLYEVNPLGMADWWSRGGVAFVFGYVVLFVIIRLVSVGLDRLEEGRESHD